MLMKKIYIYVSKGLRKVYGKDVRVLQGIESKIINLIIIIIIIIMGLVGGLESNKKNRIKLIELWLSEIGCWK